MTELAFEKLKEGVAIQDIKLRALAAEIGVSKDAPRKHFATSKAFIAALAAIGFDNLRKELESSSAKGLAHLGVSYIKFVERNLGLYKTMFYFPAEQHKNYPDLEQASQRAFKVLSSAVQGNLTGASGLSSSEGALAAWSLVHGISDLMVNGLSKTVLSADSDTLFKITSLLADNL